MIRLLVQIVLLFFLTIPAWATPDVTIHQQISPESGSIEDVFDLEIKVQGRDINAIGKPTIEPNKNFTTRSTGSSLKQTILNNQSETIVAYTFALQPSPNLTPGKYEVPRVSFTIDGEKVRLKKVFIQITETKQGRVGLDFIQLVDNLSPFVGEQILYQAEIVADENLERAILSEMSWTDFWHEPLGPPRETIRAVGNKRVHLHSLRAALFPHREGPLEIPARSANTTIRRPAPEQRGTSILGHTFPDLLNVRRHRTVERRIVAPAIELKVRPLPPRPKQARGYIPVGEIELKGSIDRTTVEQGGSLALELVVYGSGNLRPLELPPVSTLGGKDFAVYYEPTDLVAEPLQERVYHKKTFRIALVPRTDGTLKLPRIKFWSFDPQSETYLEHETPEMNIVVTPVSGATSLVTSQPAAPSFSPIPQVLSTPELESSTAVSATPTRLPAAGVSFLFFSPPALFTLLLLNVLWVWFKLATTKLPSTDPRAAIESTCSLDELAATLKDVLRTKLNIRTPSVSADDFRDIAFAQTKSSEIADATAALLMELDRLRFGGAVDTDFELTALKAEAKRIASCIEEVLK